VSPSHATGVATQAAGDLAGVLNGGGTGEGSDVVTLQIRGVQTRAGLPAGHIELIQHADINTFDSSLAALTYWDER
jgi:hypothetical protein